MDFYGNVQKTQEFVLSKYIPIGFSEPFSRFYRQGFTPHYNYSVGVHIGRGSAVLHRLPNILSPLWGSSVPPARPEGTTLP